MMSDFLEKRRRNRAKRALRLQKPYLMGAFLNAEVDRVLGIADSGKMDWAMLKQVEISDHPTPESVTEPEVRETAKQFGVRPYQLYWYYLKKTTKLQASGHAKNDYLAVLKECAAQAVKTPLKDDEKITAVILFGNFMRVTIAREEAVTMLEEGKL